ncbi:alpha/beta hydrolase family protein [Streptomyces tritici]|uniref:alpha/beta hydrolase family protein n=1 Tax=Streptomyces tritici TaxID=2054410 RepID=UPI003AF11B01
MAHLIRAAAAAALTLSLSSPLVLAGPAAASGTLRPAAASGTLRPTDSPAPAGPLAAPSPLPGAAPQEVSVRRAVAGPELPRPTGRWAVGRSVLHLVDRSRPDPWVPSADGRELMVTVHYPAARPGTGRPAPYASTDEVQAMLDGYGLSDSIPAAELAAMRTHSRTDARPAPGRYPLVVLSPGFTVSRYTLTALAEDLASRGYVVASVDHAYESLGIRTPDGRLLGCESCGPISEGQVPESRITSGRAQDVSYVLDRLTGRHAAWKYARTTIDRKRVGMAGHSIGGASAATAMAADGRVRAGVNMDGAFYGELPQDGMGGRPFMLLGTDDEMHRPGGKDHTWDAAWDRFGGWKRWLTVAGSDHFTFSDAPVFLDHFGVPRAPLPADRALKATRAYVAAFFDLHLKGVEQPLLDGPSSAHPEVVFHNP